MSRNSEIEEIIWTHWRFTPVTLVRNIDFEVCMNGVRSRCLGLPYVVYTILYVIMRLYINMYIATLYRHTTIVCKCSSVVSWAECLTERRHTINQWMGTLCVPWYCRILFWCSRDFISHHCNNSRLYTVVYWLWNSLQRWYTEIINFTQTLF